LVAVVTSLMPVVCAFRCNLACKSSTKFFKSTRIPSLSGPFAPISLIFTLPCACSSSPNMTAQGTPFASADLNCAGSFGLTLYENSAYATIELGPHKVQKHQDRLTLIPASQSILQTSILSFSNPWKPLVPNAIT
jgi:hypothetical protein